MTEREQALVGFVRALRSAGVSVPVDRTAVLARAVDALRLADDDDAPSGDRLASLYWAGRTTLLARPEDVPTYDRVFAQAFRARGQAVAFTVAQPTPVLVTDEVEAEDGEDDGLADDDGSGDPVPALRFSAREVLRHKDFALYSPDERAEARRLMAEVRLSGSLKRGRRLRPSRRGRPDLRRTVQAALRTEGEPVRRPRTRPADRPRRVVLLCDISGSMEPYSRSLLGFAHVAVVGRTRVEAFALGTRLTRLTRELAGHDADVALARASEAVADWSGGTRLGEGLRHFNDGWGNLARGAVVVVLSDGWDRGDPAELAEQMARLHRLAHKVVWVNPLKASAGYEPLAGGMAAALPHVDEFLEGHSLASLTDLAEVIAG